MALPKTNKYQESVLERTAENAITIIKEAAAENVKIIAEAAGKAAQTIADAAKNASQVVANDAATASRVLNVKNADGGSDHDFLLSFAAKTTEKLDNIGNDVKELKTGTSARILALETEKLNVKDSYPALYKVPLEKEMLDHENRIRDNERNITKIVAYGTIIVVLLNLAVALIIKFVH